MFLLTSQEKAEVVANCDHLTRLKFSPAKPFAFTEHGAVMVASVLNSERAVEVSLDVVRAFVNLRELVGTHKKLAQKLAQLERRVESHDGHIHSLFEAIRQLMDRRRHQEPAVLVSEACFKKTSMCQDPATSGAWREPGIPVFVCLCVCGSMNEREETDPRTRSTASELPPPLPTIGNPPPARSIEEDAASGLAIQHFAPRGGLILVNRYS